MPISDRMMKSLSTLKTLKILQPTSLYITNNLKNIKLLLYVYIKRDDGLQSTENRVHLYDFVHVTRLALVSETIVTYLMFSHT